MTRIKFLEIRDRHTFIPAVAIDCTLSGNSFDDYLLRRAAYDDTRRILLTALAGGRPANCDCHAWGDRTWRVAHDYIAKHWDEIADAAVIDVQFILGECPVPKESERYTESAVPAWRTTANFPDHAVITILGDFATNNPKSKGAAMRFALYENGMTVGAYVEKCSKHGISRGQARADVRWDAVKSFIAVTVPAA
jgi:hypothetical protein